MGAVIATVVLRYRRFELYRAAAALLFSLSCVLPFQSAALAAEAKYVNSLLEIRRDKVVVQQWDLSCGAAALATLLNYQHGDPVSEREIARRLMRRAEYVANPRIIRVQQGFSFLDLQRYVEQRGYQGIPYGRLKYEDLLAFAPIMVPVNFHNYKHFVVFRGAFQNRVLLADPAYGNRTVPIERFKEAWLSFPQFDKVGFVVKRRDGLEPTNQLAPQPSDFLTVG